MRKFILYFLPTFFGFQLGFSQPPEYLWSQFIHGAGTDYLRHIHTDAQGSFYIAGQSSGAVDLDPGTQQLLVSPTATQQIVYVCKLNPLGQLQWARWLDVVGNVLSICTDNAGNVYVAGTFSGTVDFDPSINTYTLSSSANFEIYLWKLDAQGSFVTVGTLSDDLIPSDLILKFDGIQNLYCAFSFTGSLDVDPGPGVSTYTAVSGLGPEGNACLLKLDLNLNLQWAGVFLTSGHSEINDFEFDTSNNVVLSLWLGGSATVDIDPGAGSFAYTPSGLGDQLVLKITPNAALVWHSKFLPVSSGSQIDLRRLELNSGDEVFWIGAVGGTVDLNPGTTTNTMATSATTVYSGVIVRLNQSGNFVSYDTLMHGAIHDFKMARDTMYFGGIFSGSVDLDPSNAVNIVTSTGGNDVFLFGLTENYQLVWKHTFGGINNDQLTDFAISPAHELYVAGWFSGTADFDPGTATNTGIAQAGADGYLSKFSLCKELPLNLSANAICAGQNATLVAVSPAAISWYSVGAGGTPVGTGSVYVTPALTAGSHTVFVSSETCSLLPRSVFVTQVMAAPALTLNVVSHTVCAGQAVVLTAAGAQTYSWSGGPASAAFTVSPAADVTYSVTGTYTDTGCSSMASVSLSVSDCSGIPETGVNALRVFPNPTNGCFFVNAADATISIYNTAGECVSVIAHNLSQYHCVPVLPPGLYYLVISGYNQAVRLAVID